MRTITTKTTIQPGTERDAVGTGFSRIYLSKNLSPYTIAHILQIQPYKYSDCKSEYTWILKIGNQVITIYDYKGHRWHVGGSMSTKETIEILKQLFPEKDIIPEQPMKLVKIK